MSEITAAHIEPLKWSFDFVPDVSFNTNLDNSWSPDLYAAVVWDHHINFNASLKASIRVEFAEYTFFQVNLESTLLTATVGL